MLNDAQVWSIIGVLAATIISMVVGMFTLFGRTLKAEIGGTRDSLRAEIAGLRDGVEAQLGGLRGEMNARFETVDARFEAMNSRLDNTDRKVDALDRDMRLVFAKLFPTQHDEL